MANEISAVIEKISALGPYLFTAAFRHQASALRVVSELPYVKITDTATWTIDPRPKTDVYVIDNVILKDGTKGFAFITGGVISPEEARMVISLLTEYGEEQTFAGPDIASLVKPIPTSNKEADQSHQPRWKFWAKQESDHPTAELGTSHVSSSAQNSTSQSPIGLAQIENRLQNIIPKCGELAFILRNISVAIKTGKDPQGLPSSRKEEVAALIGIAETLERLGKIAEAVELVLIAKAVQELESRPNLPLSQAQSSTQALSIEEAEKRNGEGVAFFAQGKYDQAIDCFNQTIELNPYFVVAYLNRANCYRMRKEYTQASLDLNRAIELQPDHADAYNMRGTVYYAQGNFSQALPEYTRAIELNPQFAVAYANRGDAYRRMGNYNQALQDLIRALELKPDYVDAYNLGGLVFYAQGNYNQALENFSYVIELNPNYAIAYQNRGDAYFQLGNYLSAHQDYTRVIELIPKYAEGFYKRGNVSYNQGNYGRAVQDFARAIELNPNYFDAYNMRGVSYFRQGNYPQALLDFNQAIKLNPRSAPAYFSRADTSRMLGSLSQALDDLSHAIDLKPDYADAYNMRGVVYCRVSNVAQALQDFARAIELNPKLAVAYQNRGNTYYNIGMRDEALRDLKFYAELMGSNTDQGTLDLIAQLEKSSNKIADEHGVPVSQTMETEPQKLLRIEEELHKRIIGQTAAVIAIADAIQRAHSGLKDPRRPIGSFIFLGSSGVGKTELAKALAEFMFDDEDALMRIDMNEYREQGTVSRLFGVPPSYVGFEEGGQLTEAVRRRPYHVILFDEIEKAHPDVWNALMPILADGHITDGQGRTVDFRNTVIIMTSKLGSEFARTGGALGFVPGGAPEIVADHKKIEETLRQTFRPEFLNRIDEIIIFEPLT